MNKLLRLIFFLLLPLAVIGMVMAFDLFITSMGFQMITISTLWFINKVLERGYEINGNVGCLIVLTGMIDTVMIATVVWMVTK